jgi:hypothetical protein
LVTKISCNQSQRKSPYFKQLHELDSIANKNPIESKGKKKSRKDYSFFNKYSKRRLQRSFKKYKNKRPINFISQKLNSISKGDFLGKKTRFNYKN